MENKNMREISMDEMDRVSGGSGENPWFITVCPDCGGCNIEKIKLPDGRIQYKCIICEREWEK